jgi:hypothetical protein
MTFVATEINDNPIGSSFYWRLNGLNIHLSPFSNLSEKKGLDGRYRLVVSTIPLEELKMNQQEIFSYFQIQKH